MENLQVLSQNRAEDERGRNAMTLCGGKQLKQKIEGGEQLIPGIPNEITIDKIAVKLPWTVLRILSLVSHGWHQAIQSRQVYDARVRSKSTQMLVAFKDCPSHSVSLIALYSIEEDHLYYLPPIPCFDQGIPDSCQFISLDGKLYVLGGYQDCLGGYQEYSHGEGSAEVYVWDLAGQRQWERCASMGEAREQFGCGVKDGKIYVFGGSLRDKPVCGSEVYDSKEDTWSPITPVPALRCNHKVVTVGEEFFLYGGEFWDSDYFDWKRRRSLDEDDIYEDKSISEHYYYATSAEVYHPLKDQWRILERFTEIGGDIDVTEISGDVVLLVGGNLYKLSELGIQVYDNSANSWSSLQPFSFGVHDAPSHPIFPVAAVAVDDEVLVLVHWRKTEREYEDDPYRTCFIQSNGLGCDNKGIVWKKLQCSLSAEDNTFMSFGRRCGTLFHSPVILDGLLI